MRQIILDTETTGLEPSQGHKIIEIGCVELINRRQTDNSFHVYLNPEREIEDGAFEVHGISNEMLQDKPCFREIAQEFIDYIRGAELVIHNAPFDVGFLNAELAAMGSQWGVVEDYAAVLDTLTMARELHPGQKNSLDALCKRYEVDNSERELHGALLDARILLDVYLAMTGGQVTLELESSPTADSETDTQHNGLDADRSMTRIIRATSDELDAHEAWLERLQETNSQPPLWRQLD